MTNRDQPDAEHIVEVLDRHQVDYVLVGGYAGRLHGARRPTQDMDIAPSTTTENLTRLAAALKELRAGIRVDDRPDGLPFDCSWESLRGMTMLNLRTPTGDLDLTFSLAGFPSGYDDLVSRAAMKRYGRVTVMVAALEDVIKSKEAAARPKDLAALPELIRLHDRSRDSGLER